MLDNSLQYQIAAQTAAGNATTQANNASGSAVASSNSATASQTQANNSASSATNSAASLFAMNARWLGSLSTDPTLDLNGNTITSGCAYFNTVLNQFRTYTGSVWQTGFTPTDSSAVNFQQAGVGAIARKIQDKARETVSVLDFGADPTGVSDSTAAFNAALASFSKTSPSGFSGWGLGKVIIPKGIYLINGTITVTSPIGVVIEGHGEYTTTLVSKNDTGVMFSLTTYINVSFSKLAINHVTSSAPSTWTNTVFSLNGTGGGRNFDLKNITTNGFNTVILHNATINEDTTVCDHCTFNSFNTFLDSSNPQAVVNSYTNCTWYGPCNQVFNIAGQQQTFIYSGNVVCDGPLIRYKNISGNFNDSGFTLMNVKFEWTTANTATGSAPKIIDAYGSYITCRVNMIDVSVRGGPTPSSDARWARLGSGSIFVDVLGGELQGLLEVVKGSSYYVDRGSYIKISGARVNDPSTWVYTDPSSGSNTSYTFPPISLEDCRIGYIARNLANITLCQAPGVPYVRPNRRVVLGRPGQAAPYFYNEVVNIDYPSYGQTILVNSVSIAVRSANNIAGRKIDVYSDSARTVLLGTFSLPTGTLTNAVYSIPITGNPVTSQGLYFVVTSTGNTLNASIIADFTSI